jgi:hypothetical protein
MDEQEFEEHAHPNLERARALFEELGFETAEIPEKLPFPAFLARIPMRAPGAPIADLPHADLIVADAGDRIQLVLPNIDQLLDQHGIGDDDVACRRILEASFGFEWARASLDANDGELRLSASIPLVALEAIHLDEVIGELAELLVGYWLERIPAPAAFSPAALPN